jgi:hypothetical protein
MGNSRIPPENIALNTISNPVESLGSVYVLTVIARHDPTQADFTKHAGELRDQAYRQKVQEYVAYWYGNVKDDAKIVDLRGNM